MELSRREALEGRRRKLQLRLAAEAFVASALQPYVDVLDYLNQHDVDFEIIQLMYTTQEWKPYVQATLQSSIYSRYGFLPAHGEERGLHEKLDKLYDRYPSTNSLRYVPSLPKIADYSSMPPEYSRDGLQQARASLGLPAQRVFLNYLSYAPLIEVSLSDILEHDQEELFNFWHGDVLIFPADLSWLIAFTLEEEWYAGWFGEQG